jgi:hypothetical protein
VSGCERILQQEVFGRAILATAHGAASIFSTISTARNFFAPDGLRKIGLPDGFGPDGAFWETNRENYESGKTDKTRNAFRAEIQRATDESKTDDANGKKSGQGMDQ